MDIYEEESAFLLDTIDKKVDDDVWSLEIDKETKDPDCKSIRSICTHIIDAGSYYIDLMKHAEDKSYKPIVAPIHLENKKDFAIQLNKVLDDQRAFYEGRWDMSDEDIEKIKINTSWGNVLDPESLLEHAVLHIMRHHRQILKFIRLSKSS